jgi:hypothetical protein
MFSLTIAMISEIVINDDEKLIEFMSETTAVTCVGATLDVMRIPYH